MLIIASVFLVKEISEEKKDVKFYNFKKTQVNLTQLRQQIIDVAYAKINGVDKFGPFRLGGKIPLGPGDGTFAPFKEIPESKFYIFIAKKNFWCINEDCGPEGSLVKTMGGWLAGERINDGETSLIFGFDQEFGLRDKHQSVIVVGDQNEKIVGIYPDKDMKDLIVILKQHPNLADFSVLKGKEEFGPLKIGQFSPLRPGDRIEGVLAQNSVTRIGLDKSFYVFAFQEEFMDKGFCYSFSCFGGGYFDYTADYNGWFSGHNDPPTLERFGLKPKKVATGEQSLLVVTDKNGVIMAIHPNKTKEDVLSILWQLPQLVLVE